MSSHIFQGSNIFNLPTFFPQVAQLLAIVARDQRGFLSGALLKSLTKDYKMGPGKTNSDGFPNSKWTMRNWLLGPLTLFLLLCKINADTDGGIYEDGQHRVNFHKVGSKLSPKPLSIAMPVDEGVYPVVQFQHGFKLSNSQYSQLIRHVASHGFIVVAPQMYEWWFTDEDATKEIKEATDILNWMQTGLAQVVPGALARPNFEKMVLMGHSRGGKVVFGVALEVNRNKGATQQYSAVVVLDPVDGTSSDHQTEPHILPGSKNSLNLGVPTLIVGTGFGPEKKFDRFPSCAPEHVNHGEFYIDTTTPAFHFVASQHGHTDFVDDHCNWGLICLGIDGVCKNGRHKKPMRKFAGGISVAFLQAALFNNTSSFEDAFSHPEQAPVSLDPPQCKSHEIGACMDQLKVKTLGTFYGLDNH